MHHLFQCQIGQAGLVDPLPSGHFFIKQPAVQAFKLDQPLCVWRCAEPQIEADCSKRTAQNWVMTESRPDQVLHQDALRKHTCDRRLGSDQASLDQHQNNEHWGQPVSWRQARHASRATWSVGGATVLHHCQRIVNVFLTINRCFHTRATFHTGTFQQEHWGFD